MGVDLRHGGNLQAAAARLNCRPSQLLDASASLVPWSHRWQRIGLRAWRDYPDRSHALLRRRIGVLHGVEPSFVLPGNGAAELFTWAARDAAEQGLSVLPAPGFADYGRALCCWQATSHQQKLPLVWDGVFPQPLPEPGAGSVLWICNPHNPTGQLWSRASLEPLLETHALVICDEAFLPLVPAGEDQSLLPLVARHSNLIVIRSLTKLFAIAGLRLGYAVAAPERLHRWSGWRDPWPVNGLATAAGVAVLNTPWALRRWQGRVQQWVQEEGAWFRSRLQGLAGFTAYPSAANYLLIQGDQSLLERRENVARQGVLLRDCRSFAGLGESWLRIGLQDRRGNRRILRSLGRT